VGAGRGNGVGVEGGFGGHGVQHGATKNTETTFQRV
jgi:hypothetical protein